MASTKFKFSVCGGVILIMVFLVLAVIFKLLEIALFILAALLAVVAVAGLIFYLGKKAGSSDSSS